MLSTDKIHGRLEIIAFKGHLSPHDIKRIEEGKIIQFNRYYVASRRKQLEEKANEIKEQWIKEAENQIKIYKSLKVQLK
jgi:hypothetical protein